MCIRDRALVQDARERVRRVERNRREQRLDLGLEDASGPLPVSYTHLRAHETVLDLVCRLLLEKKKHNIQQQSLHIRDTTKNLSHSHMHRHGLLSEASLAR